MKLNAPLVVSALCASWHLKQKVADTCVSFADLGESSQHEPRKGVCVEERFEEPRPRELGGAGS